MGSDKKKENLDNNEDQFIDLINNNEAIKL